jgi:hypothetical protein
MAMTFFMALFYETRILLSKPQLFRFSTLNRAGRRCIDFIRQGMEWQCALYAAPITCSTLGTTTVNGPHDFPNEANLKPTKILDVANRKIQSIAAKLLRLSSPGLPLLRDAHLFLVKTLRPVYSVDEWRPASITLQKGEGSCSQRTAALEATARAAGIPTRVRALAISGSFWYPRFRITRVFIPQTILLVWPQFYVEATWTDFDELHAPVEEMAARAAGGFTNTGESLFEAVSSMPVDFLGKTCGLACAMPGQDLSRFVVKNYGFFDTRDEAFELFGFFQHTLRGRAFELVFGGLKSS